MVLEDRYSTVPLFVSLKDVDHIHIMVLHLRTGNIIYLPRQHHGFAIASVGHIGAIRGPLPTECGRIPVAGT